MKILGLFTDPQPPEITDAQLLDVCVHIKPVVIIDSLIDFHPGKKESDADDMTAVFQDIRNLVTNGAAAVIVLHHTPKSGKGNAGAYRGSTAIPGAAAGAVLIEKQGKDRATLKGFKTRDGENQDIELKLNFGPETVTYEVVKSGRETGADLRDQIEDYVQKNDRCSMTEVSKAIDKRRTTVFSTIKEMISTGRLMKDSGGRLRYPLREKMNFGIPVSVPVNGSGQSEPVSMGFLVPPRETLMGTGVN